MVRTSVWSYKRILEAGIAAGFTPVNVIDV